MFRRIARFCRRYWPLLLVAAAVIVAVVLHFTKQRTAEHWWLVSTVLLLVLLPLVWGWQRIQAGNYGMNVLGITTAVAALMLHRYWVALTAVAVVIACEVIGRQLLQVAQQNQRSFASDAAHVLRGRKIVDVSVRQVQAGDKLIIQAGEVVPVDAEILEGESSFDESVITDESAPVTRTMTERVMAGSVNIEQAVTVRALSTAADSHYRRVGKLIEAAANQPAPFVHVADRFSVAFTVLALLIAGGAWAVSRQSLRFLDVLTVASIYPLLVAVPLAFREGILRLNKYGVIARSSGLFEQLAHLQTIAFSSTGTVTQGTPQLSKVTALKPFTDVEVLALAASLLQANDSSYAHAITAAAIEQNINLSRVKHVNVVAGNGLQASVKGKSIIIGSSKVLEAHQIKPPTLKDSSDNVRFVIVDGAVAGYLAIKDDLRPEAKSAIEQLRKFGMTPLLLSEYDAAYTKTLSKQLDISDTHLAASPAEKLHAVDAITERPVAYVGDVNTESSALTAADIGIGLKVRGAIAESGAADVLTVHDSLAFIVKGIATALRTVTIAKQSIVLGLGLSTALMLVFALGHFSPFLGLGLQLLINVLVTANAYRARLASDRL